MYRGGLLTSVVGVVAGLVLSLGTLDAAFAATADCNRQLNCTAGLWQNPLTGQWQCQGQATGPCSTTNCSPCVAAPCTLNGQSGHSCACNGGATKAPCSMCIVQDAAGNVVAWGCQPISCLPVKCDWAVDVPGQRVVCVCLP